MALAAGTRLGPYEVAAQIGAGGMGEVYRATDTKLKREVAVKVLPSHVAADPERLARFQREAEVLASLNHPNIAAIHGLEDAEGIKALVMELVEGPTLADRIAQGAIPVDEALPIAKQIAEALEAAHEQGIIHRDLKPANIKVRPDGTVKVLDFGLAKAMEPLGAMSPGASQAPTITTPAMTQAGMILGSAAYMSPEQARGKPVDKRADIWAFGCVLYEMLTAKRAFPGEDITDTLAAVVKLEPNWDAFGADVPSRVRQVLRVCMQKNPHQRGGDIAAIRLALEGAFETGVSQAVESVVLPQPAAWRRVLPVAVALVVAAVVTGLVVWLAMRPAPPPLVRTEVTTSGDAALRVGGADRDLAITPDGSRIVYRGQNQLLVRALDQLEPTALTGLGAPRGVFVSPDGQWVGFVDAGPQLLKKVAITGGPPVTVTTMSGAALGATWGEDGTIVYATGDRNTGLHRVSAAGGEPTVVTTPDIEGGEFDHLWPEFLPGGQAVLFTITAADGGLDNAQIAVLDLETNTQTVLVRGGSHAHYVPTGHLVYGTQGTLRAVAFDLARLAVVGTPVPVLEGVQTTAGGGVRAVVAANGTLVYMAGGTSSAALRTLVWVDRSGTETVIQAAPQAYDHPRVSPDGTRAAVHVNSPDFDIWLWDLTRTTLTRVTFDPTQDLYPVWSPDGRRLLFTSARENNTRNLFWRAADGTGEVERLTESPNRQHATAISPDGRLLIFNERFPETGDDVMQVELDETRRVTPLVQTPFIERNGIVSPDGRWLAYEADDSGRFEVYVRPFPDVNSGRWQVSTLGGTRPLWARSGEELFYISPTGAIMRTDVEQGPSWVATTPTLLVDEGYVTNPILSGRMYDITPDGERFLTMKEGGGATATPQIIVVQNWFEELRRLVPTD